MHCAHYAAARCRSCGWLPTPYATQLAAKQAQLSAMLVDDAVDWLPPVASAETGFRNRAKMVVSGSAQMPRLGILDASGAGVDLEDCPLYPPALQAAFAPLRRLIRTAGIEPYSVPRRRGELKYLLVTLAEDSGQLMVRFVLRSRAALPQLRKHLPPFTAELPQVRVLTANLQPVHQAVLEGPQEIMLGAYDALPLRLNALTLWLGPQAFFQTNTAVAAALYRQARAWVQAIDPPEVLDLYCGIGGFALHCADGRRDVLGIEASAAAVALARRGARDNRLERLRFEAADAAQGSRALQSLPPLVIVNPPRRGLGAELCATLQTSATRWLIYSSCNAESLARDLAALPGFRVRRARILDMFPHTAHCEVLCLLERGA